MLLSLSLQLSNLILRQFFYAVFRMNQKIFKILLLITFLLGNIYVSTQLTFAQDFGNTSPYNRGFDYRWLLPFLAIPLAIMLLEILNRNDTGFPYYRDENMEVKKELIGTKGGKVKKKTKKKKQNKK